MTALETLAMKTGLDEDTCFDLLNKGWTYTEKLDSAPRWEAPHASMKNQVISIVVQNG